MAADLTQPAAASADRIQLAYLHQTAFDTFLTGSSAFKELRLTSESLGQNTQTVASQEIREDRQNVDVIRTGVDAGGDINFELSHGTYDDFFGAALQVPNATPWIPVTVAIMTNGRIDVTAATGTFAVDGVSTSAWTNDPSAINIWVKTADFVNAGNNGYFKVLTITASTSFTVHQTGLPLIDETSAGTTINITEGGQIINGTAFNAFSLQKDYSDLTSPFVFERLTGMAVNTFSLNVPVDGVVTGTFGMMGKDSSSSATNADSGTIIAATTTEVMAAVEDVSVIYENTDTYGSTAFTMNLNNNLRTRLEIATLGAVSIGSGTIDLTGTLQAYFGTVAAMDRYLNFTSSNIAIAFEDSAGNAYVIDIPEIKYTDGKRVAGGRNTDILADLTWMAKKDPIEGHTIKIVKF